MCGRGLPTCATDLSSISLQNSVGGTRAPRRPMHRPPSVASRMGLLVDSKLPNPLLSSALPMTRWMTVNSSAATTATTPSATPTSTFHHTALSVSGGKYQISPKSSPDRPRNTTRQMVPAPTA
eukprot:scaffold149_cov315-Pinguiococcus_pyrenoidosus.AAC.153